MPWNNGPDTANVQKMRVTTRLFLCHFLLAAFQLLHCPLPASPGLLLLTWRAQICRAVRGVPHHLAMMSAVLLINNGTVFPGTQSREHSAWLQLGWAGWRSRKAPGRRDHYLGCWFCLLCEWRGLVPQQSGCLSLPPGPAVTALFLTVLMCCASARSLGILLITSSTSTAHFQPSNKS